MGRLVVALAVVVAGCLISCAPQQKAPSAGMGSIEYRRSGGIAGFDDHLSIDGTGKATLTRRSARSEFVVDRATLDQLYALFDKAQFSKLGKEYLPSGKGADLFQYEVAYNGHTVRTADTAVPPALQPILDSLNQIVQTGGQ